MELNGIMSASERENDGMKIDMDYDETFKIMLNVILAENQQVYLKDKLGNKYRGEKVIEVASTVIDFGNIPEIEEFIIFIE